MEANVSQGQNEKLRRVVIFGLEHSYYTGKLRSYLRYKRIEHEAISSDFNVYRSIILPNVGWSVIPVVIIDFNGGNMVLQDTTVIIDYFEKLFPSSFPVKPQTSKQRAVSMILELYGDEGLKLAAMHYRWSFPEQFEYLVHEFDRGTNANQHGQVPMEKRENSVNRTKRVMKRLAGSLPIIGVTEATIPGVEVSYRRFLEAMNKHFSMHQYLIGSAPCVGDFGLIGPLYAHLYRDPVPGQEMKQTAPNVAEWVERMNGVSFPGYEKSTSSDSKGQLHVNQLVQKWLPNDNIPATLNPILQLFFDEQVPVLLATIAALRNYIKSCNPEKIGSELPRLLGTTEFIIGGCTGSCGLFSFVAWKIQRVLDALDNESREYLLKFGSNAKLFLELDISDCRMTRKDFPQKASTIVLERHYSPYSAL